jgi:hypothetical protein
LANPEITKLESYSTKVSDEFWNKFQKRELPKKPKTRINTDTLEEKITDTKKKLLPHQFERAKKALSFLKYGAPSFQKTPLPSCCVKNTPDTSQFGDVPRVQREEDQVRPDCPFAPTQLALYLRFALLKGESCYAPS